VRVSSPVPTQLPTGRSSRQLSTRLSLLLLAVVYLSMALTFSSLTRVYEADDEPAHVQNIEYIVGHHALPRIGVANGLESHQPPLYYVLEAAWQDVLRIHAFTPVVVPAKTEPNSTAFNRLLYSTHYTPSQHADAVRVHELRILSVLLGLGTVLLTYAAARIIGTRELLALSCGLVVALWPKALVAFSSVTNDALVILLCTLAIVLFLLSERARAEERFRHRRMHLFAMGLVLGAAAITKLNSLPVAVVLFALATVPLLAGSRRRHKGSRAQVRLVLDVTLAVLGFFAVSGWWFIRNHDLYGQFLATRASEQYLSVFLLHPVPWNPDLIFRTFPRVLLWYSWYNQPNLGLPLRMNQALAVLGLPCLVVGAWVVVRHRAWISRSLTPLSAIALPGSIAGGLAALLIIIKTNSIGDTRDAFVALTAIAIVLTVGSSWLFSRIGPRLELVGVSLWPVVFLSLDVYVLIRFLIPLGGL